MKNAKLSLLVLTAIGLMLMSNISYSRHAALLIDADNGDVLYELEANQAWYPASLTKMMTLYMTFTALESGRLRLSHEMSVSSHAAHQPTSKLGLRAWESISVEDAILAIITRSANDAAVVLAEEIGGTEQQFAIKMTAAAHGIGMYGSHFMNATGLPHDWQTSTAHDMGLLAYRIMRDFPQYYPYFAADSMYFKGREYRGINKFVAYYPGAEGMKTGYTCGSGYNLVATARQYGKRLIGVVLGGKSSSERYDQMFTMMDTGFSNPYSAYPAKNINTMSKNSVGTPPYQLSCGHRPSSHFASRHIDNDDDDHVVRYVKKINHSGHSHLAVNHKPIEHLPVTKIRISGKTKTIVKESHEKRGIEKSGKIKTAELSNKIGKTKGNTKAHTVTGKPGKLSVASAAKPKHGKKTEKPEQIASSSTKSKGKGYYSPKSQKTSAATSSAKKGKGYFKPDNAVKTVAKNNPKTKRNTKTKS